jgi:OmcA/MtrC family decaheme c-type cytochrome
MAVSLDSSPSVARRVVVDRNKCNVCHKDLGSPAGMAIHGGNRRNPQLCVMCHNANLQDPNPAAGVTTPEPFQWKYLIHSIHMGASRTAATSLNGLKTTSILFPGDQGDCLKCHNAGTYTLPLPDGVLPATVTVNGKVAAVYQPMTLACAGCHAGQSGFAAHAATMTSATSGEACAACHGAGKQFDVTKVHYTP